MTRRQTPMPSKRTASSASGPAGDSSNEAALLLKLKELTGGKDPEAADDTWLESLVVTSAEPLACDDPQDDLKRELALCAQPPGRISAVRCVAVVRRVIGSSSFFFSRVCVATVTTRRWALFA